MLKQNEQDREEGMCHLFASQNPDSYVYETRSIRLNGQSTSIRLEKIFWNILEQIAAAEGLSVPSFISTLHREVLLMWGPVPNFTSHLRCICLVALEKRGTELPAQNSASAKTRAASPRSRLITPNSFPAPLGLPRDVEHGAPGKRSKTWPRRFTPWSACWTKRGRCHFTTGLSG